MVPIYSIACLLSIPFYEQHVYIASIYEFYESLVIAAFFALLCQYLHVDENILRRVFTFIEPKPWIHPLRFLVVHIGRNKKGRTVDGLRFFNIIWIGVFQFCAIKFLGSLAKCITEATDTYCEDSNDASHAKIWIMVIEMLSLVTAMLCLLQFYHQTKAEIIHQTPLLKFLAIKLVVFLFYVQTTGKFIFGFLTKEEGAIQPTTKISYPSWSVGIPNTILCFEMAAVSILHLWAYPYKGYEPSKSNVVTSAASAAAFSNQHLTGRVLADRVLVPDQTYVESIRDNASALAGSHEAHANILGGGRLSKQGGRWGLRALVDVLNISDIVRSVMKGFRWLLSRRKYEDTDENSGRIELLKTANLSDALTLVERGAML
ncbi:DUF300 domain-containing protein [Colletotrichum truncatum]|uniref:DUF300 domain-containing protein n=1 Tax=Colletotrichum truncatum TaxID=5467 RepID=A0ACC3ZG65_COLTU|nr:duf300 domain-containing protein [Colletotrichum truncatum]KAF6802008.1 duf300 domain-containing protein [Colletotrichum truncatum]